MGAFLRGSAYAFLAQLGIGVAAGAYEALQDARIRAAEGADPLRNMDEESRALYHALFQFRSRDDWDGYNRWLDRNVAGELPLGQRLSVWEGLGRLRG